MMDITSPITWLWAALVLIFSLVLFKRQALLFWLLVIPSLVALKLDVPALMIAAGVSAALVGLTLQMFFAENPTSTLSATLKSEETGQAIDMHLRLPLGLSILFIMVLNIGLAWIVLQFFDLDAWFQEQNIPGKFYTFAYVLMGFISALLLSMLFVTTAPRKSV